MRQKAAVLCAALVLLGPAPLLAEPSLMENLGRGVVAVRTSATEVFVGRRVLGADPPDVAFNLYRSAAGGPPVLLNAAPLTGPTHFVDGAADLAQANAWFVRPIVSAWRSRRAPRSRWPRARPCRPTCACRCRCRPAARHRRAKRTPTAPTTPSTR